MPFHLPLLPTSLRSGITVIDCGARHVAWGRFIRGARDRVLLQDWAIETFETEPTSETDWSGRAGRALATMGAREKRSENCRLALAGHNTLVKFARLTAPGRNSRQGAIEFEARQSIPLPLEQVVWDHFPVVENGSEIKFMLAAVKRDLAAEVAAAAETAGFRLCRMVPSGLTLLNAFRYNHPGEGDGVLVVEIGARSTHLVYLDRTGFFIRTLSLGGDQVTQAVAEELRIDFGAAEVLKVAVLSGELPGNVEVIQHDAVRRACEQFAGRLHLEIVRSTVRFRCHSGAMQPSSVYLCGGGALIPDLPVRLADKLAARVVRLDPLRNVGLTLSAHPVCAAVASRLAGLVGLGASLVGETCPGFNLLPPAMVKAQAMRRRQPALVGAAVLAAAAPLPALWAERQVARSAERASGELDQSLIPLRAQSARNTRDLARIDEMRRRIEAARRIVESKAGWLAFFADLQTRLTQIEDVWLEKLQVAPSTEPAARGATAAVPAPARFVLMGRILERNGLDSAVNPTPFGRARRLLQTLRASPYVAAIENERFDGRALGVSRFELTLVMNPNRSF